MTVDDPITEWLVRMQASDQEATEMLWQSYGRRVMGMARKVLGMGSVDAAFDKDVAQSVFRTVFIRAPKGKFPKLDSRESFWNLLAEITFRKALKRKHKEGRQPTSDMDQVSAFLDDQPSPETDVDIRDTVQRLCDLLDPDAQRVLALRLEACDYNEINKRTGLSRATIARKVALIRATWEREMFDEFGRV